MKDHQTLPAPEFASAALPSPSNQPERLLVVEDDGDIRHLNTQALLRSGYAVDAVADGAAAWEALVAHDYDLMITDNGMPRLSGLQLLQKLRRARMDLPVIMATGTLPVIEFAERPWLVPDATLLKPYTVEELLHLVKKVLCEADGTTGTPSEGATNSARRILVVDEDPGMRRLSMAVLIQHGYDVCAAADGAAGWAALQAHDYNLLVTEQDLPGLTGVGLVKKLRAARMELPVVMAAAKLPARELARYPALLIAATLEKPFPVAALLDTVNEVLRATAAARARVVPTFLTRSDRGYSQPAN